MVALSPTLRERAPFILFPEHWNHFRQLKRSLIKRGYVNQLSFWADFRNINTPKEKYIRVEIMVKGQITQNQVVQIKQVLTDYPPLKEYAVYTYDVFTDEFVFIEGMDQW